MAGELISQIGTHDTAPPVLAKMELENPTGPTSEWSTLAEVFGTIMTNFMMGYGLSNDSVTSATKIDIAPGCCQSDDGTWLIKNTSTLVKSITSTWAVGTGNGGLDIGSVIGSTWYHVYAITRTDTGVVDVLLSQAPPNTSASFTATHASPAVFTWNGGTVLPFQNGCPMVLSGGSVGGGFTAGTVYYVVSSNQTAGTFELSATQGGAAINSTATLSGTATPTVQMPTNYTKKRRIGSVYAQTTTQIMQFVQTIFMGGRRQTLHAYTNGASPLVTDLNVTMGSGGNVAPNPNPFTLTLVPPGVIVVALGGGQCLNNTASNVASFAPLSTAISWSPQMAAINTNDRNAGQFDILTNVGQQIGWFANSSTSGSTLQFACHGYEE